MSPEMQAFLIQWAPQAAQLRSYSLSEEVKESWLKLSMIHQQGKPEVIRGLWTEFMREETCMKILFKRYLLIEPFLEAVMGPHSRHPDAEWNQFAYVRPLAQVALSFLMAKPGDAATIVNFTVWQATEWKLPYVDFEMVCRIYPQGAWIRPALDTLYDTGKALFSTREIPDALASRIGEIRNG